MKRTLPFLSLLPLLGGCARPTPTPDMSPIGAGLAVIGLGIVLAAFVIALLGRSGGSSDE